MKGIIILAVVIVALGAGLWCGVMRETMADQGNWLLVAIGNPKDKTIEMVVSVELGLTMRERPRLDERGEPLWDEWVAQHFELRDTDGNVVPGARIAHSLLVNEEKTMNVPEFYIKYDLQKGRDYTLDQIPRAAKKTRYRHAFTAPSEALGPQRVQVLPVKGDK